jgi:hypothetical protein
MTRLRITPLNGQEYDTADLALERLFQPAAQRLLQPFPRWMAQGRLCIRVEHSDSEAQTEYETQRQTLINQGEWYRLPARTVSF